MRDLDRPPMGDEIPAWLDRIRARLRSTRQDAVRKVFLERAFEAIIEITQTLPSSALEETVAAGNNVLVLLKALQSPEILPELERYEPLASPYLKGVEAQRELIKKAGGLMTSEEVANILGLTRQAVDKRRQSNKLIAIPQGQHGFGYPACQFDSRGPLHGLEEMLNSLQVSDGWMQLTYLLSCNADLENRSPLELLREGRNSAVAEAAGKFGEHGAL
jgi:hypothetical protein